MVARLLGIRPEDRRDATVAFLTLLGVMTAHAILETSRDALFLSRMPARDLPWAYILIAALSLVVAEASRRVRALLPGRLTLCLALLVGALGTAAFHVLVRRPSSAGMLLALYVWTGLLATSVVVELWLVVARILDFGQAKRVFAVVGAGGLAGAVLGSAISGGLLMMMGPRALLLVAASILLVTAPAPLFFSSARAQAGAARRSPAPASSWLSMVRSDPYLRRLLIVALSSSMLVTTVDYVFKATASVDLAPDQLGPFFARFYGAMNAIALVVQLLVAPRLLRRLGVNGSLLLLPGFLLAGSIAFVLSAGLGAALLVRGADGALRHSLNRTGTEILYVPLPPSVRERFKGFVEAVGQRGGQGLVSIGLLALTRVGVRPADLGVALVVLAAVWLAAMSGIKPHYVELFRKNLREGGLETHYEAAELDLHSFEALIAALSSHNDHEVLASLDLLASYGKTNLVPALILYHPSTDVVLRAFDLFAGSERPDVDRLTERLMSHEDERIRATALRYSAARAGDSLLHTMREDPSPFVRITALVELIRRGEIAAQKSHTLLTKVIEQGTADDRRALAFAARDLPRDRYSWVLVKLAMVNEPGLASEVVRAMAAAPDLEYVPTLVRLLAVRDSREDARAGIIALGDAALAPLAAALEDTSLPVSVRRHLPRTIARFGGQEALKTLVDRFAIEPDETVGSTLVRALDRMRADDPNLVVDRRALLGEARRCLERAVNLLYFRVVVQRASLELAEAHTPASEILGALLSDKEAGALERVFRILKVIDPLEDFESLFSGLRSRDRRLRETGRELVIHVVPDPLRSGILAMLGDGQPEARLRDAVRFHDPPLRLRLDRAVARLSIQDAAQRAEGQREFESVYVDSLRAMLLDPSDALRGVASYCIAELGLDELAPEMRSAQAKGDSALGELSEEAMDMFERQQEGVVRAG